MTRTKKFIRGVISGYASLAVNILFTMGAIPVALHYLSKEEFGLWSLVVQLTGYLALLDLGMGVAIARFLADYKDDINGGAYGSVLRTGQAVFLIQAVLVAVIGSGMTWLSPGFLNIPDKLEHSFIVLMSVQCVLAGLSFATKMAGSPLWCHQRYDISNLAGSSSLILNFGAMWLGFYMGMGLYSMVLGAGLGFLINLAIPWGACHRLGFYPSRGCWGRFEWRLFREMFGFGRDIFLMSLGSQLASASQVIVLSRLMGLEAVSIWAVAGKAFTFAQQFVSRIFDSSAGGLAEMLVRQEKERLRERFRDLVALTGSVAAVGAAGIALFNRPFVEVWTSGRIGWANENNFLLGILLMASVLVRCHTGLVGITRLIRSMKYIYLLEGLGVIAVSFVLVPRCGIAGMLVASILSNICITGSYAVMRSAAFFNLPLREVVFWPIRGLGLGLVLFCIAVPLHSSTNGTTGLGLAIWLVVFGAISGLLFYWFGLDSALRLDVQRFFSRTIAGISQRWAK